MTIQEAFYKLKADIQAIYADSEATALAHYAMEAITELQKIDRLIFKDQLLNEAQVKEWLRFKEGLQLEVPIQYLIGRAYFMDFILKVNPHVLIPRPETEELIHWIRDEYQCQPPLTILDIGTGSGCIAIALAKLFPNARVLALDVSQEALATAKINSQQIGVDIDFIYGSIFDEDLLSQFPECDLIVSNPPYIPESEKHLLDKNVAAYEPGLALFVPDQDPLVFYKAIKAFSRKKLRKHGSLFFEIHQHFADELCHYFKQTGICHFELRKDFYDHDRMMRIKL